jgi:hypothetical protein
MILAYIAGRFTGADDIQVELNIRAAEDAARRVISSTELVACLVPHSIGRYFKQGPGSPAYWYAATMEMCERCDCILMVPGWETSSGSVRERHRMVELGRPIFTEVEDLVRWASRSVTTLPCDTCTRRGYVLAGCTRCKGSGFVDGRVA